MNAELCRHRQLCQGSESLRPLFRRLPSIWCHMVQGLDLLRVFHKSPRLHSFDPRESETWVLILLFLVLIGVLIENLFQFPKVPRSGDNVEEAPARLQNPAEFLCRQW